MLKLTLLLPLLTNVAFAANLPQYATYGKNVVIGGGALMENNTQIWTRIVERAGGKGVARIGVVSGASATPLDSANYYIDLLVKTYGALEATFIPITIDSIGNNSDPGVLSLIRRQTGFFVSGGDQSRLVTAYLIGGNTPSPALLAIRERFHLGAVVSGTSAGATILTSAPMATGGVSWNALTYGAKESAIHTDDLTYHKSGGFGICTGYTIDTHFSNRGREGRMIRLLSDTQHFSNGVDYGIGVSENTALAVSHIGTGNEIGEIFGELGVTFIDVSKSYTDPAEHYFTIRNIFVSYLTEGDKIDMKTRAVTFSPSKHNLAGKEGYDHALTSNDIFYGSRSHSRKPEFLRVAASIFDARKDTFSYGSTYERHPEFKVRMSKTGSNTAGYVERRQGFHSDIHSYKNMYVEIY